MTAFAMPLAYGREALIQVIGDVVMAPVRKRFEVEASAFVLTRRLRRLYPDPRADAIPEDWLALLEPLDRDHQSPGRPRNGNGRHRRDRPIR